MRPRSWRHNPPGRFRAVRPAYQLGYATSTSAPQDQRLFEDVERDLERGWVTVRTAAGDWASVREFAAEGFRVGREERVGVRKDSPAAADRGTPSYQDDIAST